MPELSDRVERRNVEFPKRSVQVVHFPRSADVLDTGIEAVTPQGAKKQFLWYRNCVVGDLETPAGQERAIELLMSIKRYMGIDAVLYEPKNVDEPSGLLKGLYVEHTAHDQHLDFSALPSAEVFSRADPVHFDELWRSYRDHLHPTLFR